MDKEKQEVIYVSKAMPKEGKFGKIHNPNDVYQDNFHVICTIYREKMEEGLSEEERDEIRQKVRDLGDYGEVFIQKNFGGPGRKRMGETTSQWHGKKLSGLRTIERLEVD